MVLVESLHGDAGRDANTNHFEDVHRRIDRQCGRRPPGS